MCVYKTGFESTAKLLLALPLVAANASEVSYLSPTCSPTCRRPCCCPLSGRRQGERSERELADASGRVPDAKAKGQRTSIKNDHYIHENIFIKWCPTNTPNMSQTSNGVGTNSTR